MEKAAGGYYFVADVHLGAGPDAALRERLFVDYLRELPEDAEALYILGDLFDFWAEYRDVAPRGFVRVLGALAALSDRGVKLVFYPGNHDWWLKGYLESELRMRVVQARYAVEQIGALKVCIGHGDGVGRRSFRERLIYRMFRSRVLIALLRSLHPRLVYGFARRWSSSSRRHHQSCQWDGQSPIIGFAREYARDHKVDAFIFGHDHREEKVLLDDGTPVYLLGDWAKSQSGLNFSGK